MTTLKKPKKKTITIYKIIQETLNISRVPALCFPSCLIQLVFPGQLADIGMKTMKSRKHIINENKVILATNQ